ncbi:hypothetical protein F5J12DRAFT_863259 [Pisolithus orientalis]|uniref:uncharacterized protein n=1 Tax=Pisolithus orientalis TaxID=936130 RepID=UPI002223FD0A|nr:uncharacterized protein F5J12DRAFT_863259 [Pisolithus orientalis]KAI5990322.1 hypothetical protein F5J12DRAFT_863259 [Pisolithus orientalis]
MAKWISGSSTPIIHTTSLLNTVCWAILLDHQSLVNLNKKFVGYEQLTIIDRFYLPAQTCPLRGQPMQMPNLR